METSRVLVDWAIRYDSIYQMPEYAEGNHVGKGFVRLTNVDFVDMIEKYLVTSDGDKFFLGGNGKQIITIDNQVFMNETMKKIRQVLQD